MPQVCQNVPMSELPDWFQRREELASTRGRRTAQLVRTGGESRAGGGHTVEGRGAAAVTRGCLKLPGVIGLLGY